MFCQQENANRQTEGHLQSFWTGLIVTARFRMTGNPYCLLNVMFLAKAQRRKEGMYCLCHDTQTIYLYFAFMAFLREYISVSCVCLCQSAIIQEGRVGAAHLLSCLGHNGGQSPPCNYRSALCIYTVPAVFRPWVFLVGSAHPTHYGFSVASWREYRMCSHAKA